MEENEVVSVVEEVVEPEVVEDLVEVCEDSSCDILKATGVVVGSAVVGAVVWDKVIKPAIKWGKKKIKDIQDKRAETKKAEAEHAIIDTIEETDEEEND